MPGSRGSSLGAQLGARATKYGVRDALSAHFRAYFRTTSTPKFCVGSLADLIWRTPGADPQTHHTQDTRGCAQRGGGGRLVRWPWREVPWCTFARCSARSGMRAPADPNTGVLAPAGPCASFSRAARVLLRGAPAPPPSVRLAPNLVKTTPRVAESWDRRALQDLVQICPPHCRAQVKCGRAPSRSVVEAAHTLMNATAKLAEARLKCGRTTPDFGRTNPTCGRQPANLSNTPQIVPKSGPHVWSTFGMSAETIPDSSRCLTSCFPTARGSSLEYWFGPATHATHWARIKHR